MNAITDTRRINETTYTPISFKVENENICIEVSVTDSRIHELSVEGKTNPLSREIGKILTHDLIGLPLADFLSMGSMILLEKNKEEFGNEIVSGIQLVSNSPDIIQQIDKLIKTELSHKISASELRGDISVEPVPLFKPDWWVEISPEEKKEILQTKISKLTKTKNNKSTNLNVEIVDRHDRIFCHFDDEINVNEKPNIIFNIERQLSNSLGFELELFCLEKKDVHKLRRL